MDDIDAAFDDAYRTNRIEEGDDPSTLPNPYSRPSLAAPTSKTPSTESSNAGGGFIVDQVEAGYESGGGGFMVDEADDEQAGGGFILDDDESAMRGGGFIFEDEDDHAASSSSSPRAAENTRPKNIPLSAIPEALANLGLDSADPSVLSLFADTAYVPSSASRRRLAPGVKPEKVVGRQEFQQVASILLDEMRSRSSSSKTQKRNAQDRAEEDQDDSDHSEPRGRRRPTRKAAAQGRRRAAEIVAQDDDDGANAGGGFIVDEEADDSEEDFEASRQRRRRRTNKARALDTGSDLTSDGDDDDDEAELGDPTRRRRRRGGARAAVSPSPSPSFDDDSEQNTPKRQRRTRKSPSAPTIRSLTHLNPLQRATTSDLYQLLLDRLPPSAFPSAQRRIGTTELTAIFEAIGEKLPPKEIEEMLEEGAKLFAPATADEAGSAERKSSQAIKGVAAAQGIAGASVGLDEFAGILVHNRLL
ncbi:hypothetical protein EX895_006202 [Sporisorium graminicola]|uniref:Uncharacterized protein n=1 Tax=Sporisorium graminicola TaxID=280036 RepID=A0A4U7KQ54_9BASI|nr:hypothetical protein EX895_006202 [Sporisorium graminicola]TKY85122.1 hypothetical protein EX895_006202 [Sporisorium graminicola]